MTYVSLGSVSSLGGGLEGKNIFFTHLAACVPRERQSHPPDINLLDFDRAIAQAFDKGRQAMEEEYECRDLDPDPGASLAPGRKPGGGMPVLLASG